MPAEQQGLLLISLLTGKAQEDATRAPPETLKSYPKLRDLLHESFDYTADTFRQALREESRAKHDSYPAMWRSINRTWDCWLALEKATTPADIKDIVLKDCFVQCCPDALRIALLDAGPLSGEATQQKAHAWEKNRQRVRNEAAVAKAKAQGATSSTTPAGADKRSHAAQAPAHPRSSVGGRVAAGAGEKPGQGRVAGPLGKGGAPVPVTGGGAQGSNQRGSNLPPGGTSTAPPQVTSALVAGKQISGEPSAPLPNHESLLQRE